MEKVYKQLKEKIHNKIREEGLFPAILLIAIYSISFPICVLIRLIRPLIFIRFGALHPAKIGPFSAWLEMYLCEKDAGVQPKNTLDIFSFGKYPPYVCNNQLLAMWKRVLRVNKPSKYLYKMMDKLPFGKKHIISTTNGSRDVRGLLEKGDTHLKFLSKEIVQAKLGLSRMGIGENDKYVLMINRGQRYLDETFPERDWEYHAFRNCNIADFMLMAEELTAKGYFVIRMGHLVSDLMKTDNPKIIEYDHDGFRTELLDLYLGANCRYLVGSDTGYFGVPGWLFRRPVVYVNLSQLGNIAPWMSRWLHIFRKLWIISEKRFMTVREMLESGAAIIQHNEGFKKMGIEVGENTPQEIFDVVDEMEKRLDGDWQENEEDEELQKRFWSYSKGDDHHGVIRSRIGAKFLRENRDLLK